jgi:two-component system, sensor histidine kinase YesM
MMYTLDWFVTTYKKISLRKKILLFIFPIILISSFTSLSSTYFTKKIVSNYDSLFQRIVVINEVTEEIEDLNFQLQEYLLTQDVEYVESLGNLYSSIEHKLAILDTELINEDSHNIYTDIINMYDVYLEKSRLSINEKEQHLNYVSQYQEASQINAYIISAFNKLKSTELENIETQYNILKDKASIFQNTVVLILSLLFLCCVMFAWEFSKSILKPIQKLMNQTSKIINGSMEMKDIEIDSHDEIGQLTTSFNKMIRSIQQFIKEMNEKAQLEKLLKEAELKALQSQVNPHFLFNVMSTLTESALIEGAEKTLSTVEKIAFMMRYSLTSFQKKVTLNEELTMVRNYCDLQFERFGDRISFIYDLPNDIPDIYVPAMTLQPMVENALIHGLEKKIDGGRIEISLKKVHGEVIIHIKDNGFGMREEILYDLLKKESKNKNTGHTTGIGIYNVYERLRLFFKCDWDILEITSKLNKGTIVTIRLPVD